MTRPGPDWPPGPEWLQVNRANWDERVGIHLAASSHELSSLRRGEGRLNPIEEAELGPVAGLCTCNVISAPTGTLNKARPRGTGSRKGEFPPGAACRYIDRRRQ